MKAHPLGRTHFWGELENPLLRPPRFLLAQQGPGDTKLRDADCWASLARSRPSCRRLWVGLRQPEAARERDERRNWRYRTKALSGGRFSLDQKRSASRGSFFPAMALLVAARFPYEGYEGQREALTRAGPVPANREANTNLNGGVSMRVLTSRQVAEKSRPPMPAAGRALRACAIPGRCIDRNWLVSATERGSPFAEPSHPRRGSRDTTGVGKDSGRLARQGEGAVLTEGRQTRALSRGRLGNPV